MPLDTFSWEAYRMNRRFSAVVFDMDGLMFNTEDIYDLVGKEMLERRGLIFDLELKLKMMGRTSREAYSILQRETGIKDSLEELEAENDQILSELIPKHIAMMPGLITLLDHIESIGLPVGVATSSSQPLAEMKIGTFGLLERFQHLVTGDHVSRGKPDPEIYLNIADRFAISPTEMLVFEDSVVGSRAASASGAFTVAVPGLHSRQLDYSHVDLIVDRLDSPAVLKLLPA